MLQTSTGQHKFYNIHRSTALL
uniref:Uncharacterized protein n=1 Tax=Anopheles arabiensis TaxID=7173 RepID=A0A182IF80_ANOAR